MSLADFSILKGTEIKKCLDQNKIPEIREDPNTLTPPPFGHCPNSDWTPPPALNRALWGTFFRAIFYHSAGLYASENGKCPKPSGQAFRPPQKQGYAHLNLDNSSLNKCPKPSGQALFFTSEHGPTLYR